MSLSGERSGMAKGKACEECSRRCSSLHRKRKNSDPCLSSFFKIMFGERFSEFLFFPPKFAPMVAGLVKQGTYLKDANGGRWRMEFARVDGSLALGKGWGDFVKHHGLVLGDFVVLDLVGSHFDVKMYGRTACEKLNVGKKQGELNNGGNKCAETGKFQGQQSKVVNEKGFEESNVKKNKPCSEKSFRVPAAKVAVLKPSNGPETGKKPPRNEGTAGSPIVIDLETDDDEPKAPSNERAGDCEKGKAHKMECGKPENSRNEKKSKRASDVELQQSKFKCPKKEKLDDITRNKNGNPQHGECSRDVELTGKAKTKTTTANGFHPVEAAATNRASAAGLQRSEVFEKKKGGDETLLKYKRGSCGKNKVVATGKLVNDLLERSKKLVAGFATENKSKAARLSGNEVELVHMGMGVLKSEPISAQISFVIPSQTRTHLDLSAPLPMLKGKLILQRRVVMLKDPNAKLWPVLYHRTSATDIALKGGWGSFADAHNIQAGDECIFAVENCSQGVYAIHIVRHHVDQLTR